MTRLVVIAVIAGAAIAVVRGDQQATFRSAVDVVRVDVSVMNGIVPVAGLTRDHFVLADNSVPQTVADVSLDTVPLDLVMVLDTSGSLAGERLSHLIDGANSLVKSLRADDTVALMTFSEAVRLAVKPTRDRAPIVKALSGLVADGSTSVNDAIFLGLQLRSEEADRSRPVLLLFSDGRDTSSWLSADQVLEATRRSGMVVHVVELVQENWMSGFTRGLSIVPAPSDFLRRVADVGGGRRWFAKSPKDLRELFGRALNELRARYLITYSPTGVSREGWHDVKVTLKNARGEVTARPGYFVGGP